MRRRVRFASWLVVIAIGSFQTSARAQSGEWRSYAGDAAGRKYAPLDQITKNSVVSLKIVWRRPAVDPGLAALDPQLP